VTDEEKKTRRARRSQRAEGSEGEPEQVKDRNLRLRDEAARRRAGRKREREAAAAQGLDTRERVDDALTRTAKVTTGFIEKNFSWLQWVFLAAIGGLIAYFVWDYRTKRQNEKAADALMVGVASEQGKVAGVGEWRSADPNLVDPRPEFGTDDERLKAAEEKYRVALGERATPGTRMLAHVGLGGVLYDQGKYAAARAEYEAVKSDKAAPLAPEALARSIEGIGLCYEAEGKQAEALKAFEALEDQPGYANLAKYHQARVLNTQGQGPKALELLKKVREDLSKDQKPGSAPSYLAASTEELMRIIDPRSVPKQGAGQSITPEQLEELKRQMEDMQRRAKEAPMPSPEAPSPEAPSPEAPPEAPAPGTPAP
jgi:tetratricopeptide (TPR) repeat protein